MSAPGRRSLDFSEPVLFELKQETCAPPKLPDADAIEPADHIPMKMLRESLGEIPQLSEPEVVRHYTRYSNWNYGVENGFYPLGSCTMKYNPKINEVVARLPGFAGLHPRTPDKLAAGALEMIYRLEKALAEITGMAAITLQPAAGAQGELTGMLMVRAYHKKKGLDKTKVIIPDSAHGTNPASAALAGFDVVAVKTGADGVLKPEDVAEVLDDQTAALMMTNPNTLGLFESHIGEIAEMLHEKDALLYCDGANMNALMGKVKLGEIGVDLVQLNLHKSFSTPHGGGGPGSGPVGVCERLIPFLPTPVVESTEGEDGPRFRLNYDPPDTIGKLKTFYGNFSIMVRALAYIDALGAEGLARATEMAVLNANYVRARLADHFHLPFASRSLHEVVFSDKFYRAQVSTLDIAKSLIDRGFHPPTTYFPLIVSGALMIEPTETESQLSIDQFCEAMIEIAGLAATDPQQLKDAPINTALGRLDETRAARKPVLRYRSADPECQQ